MPDLPHHVPPTETEDESFRDAVRRTAYFMWEQDGRPHGRDQEYYMRALEMHRRHRDYDEWLQDAPATDRG